MKEEKGIEGAPAFTQQDGKPLSGSQQKREIHSNGITMAALIGID